MIVTPQLHRDSAREDFVALGIILFCCVLFAALRLGISSTMELDEAEQFLSVAHLWSNNNQPPLYTWILRGISRLIGNPQLVVIGTKYIFIFLFYSGFYVLARKFWAAGRSLVTTGSLLLFLTYSYDFARHLTHTVLVAFLAVAVCLVSVGLLQDARKTGHYAALGTLGGLGFLAKYNFALFLAALVMAFLSCGKGRRALSDRRILLSAGAALILILPHLFFISGENYPTLDYALRRAGAGRADMIELGGLLRMLKLFLIPFIPFLAIFTLLFGRALSRGPDVGRLTFFRWLALYGFGIPLLNFLLLQSSHFYERWLAPLFFTVPLALFSFIGGAEDRRFRGMGFICALILTSVFGMRAFAGFCPDLSGKAERIHIPFKELSAGIAERLEKEGVSDLKELSITSNDWFLTANLAAELPGAKAEKQEEIEAPDSQGRTILLVWHKESSGTPASIAGSCPPGAAVYSLKSDYLHSRRLDPYELSYAIIPPRVRLSKHSP